MNTQHHLDRQQFELLLDDKAEPSIPPHVSQHLEECPRCREQLEQAAADPSWWSCVEQLDNNSLQSTFASAPLDGPTSASGTARRRRSDRPMQDFAELLDQPSHPEMLGQLNQFEIERVIGRGGMGVVFKGFDRELHRPVAIKLMSPHLAHNATARKRFEREARAAAAVVHPNVIPIHGVSLFKGQPLIVMPLVAGSSLQAHVEQHGPLETKDVVRIGMQIAAGLSAAHDQGLIHRDIKPANILLEQDVSRVVITDFGLARAADELAMTQTGWLAGTPHYMSPEQARGTAIDARSDLFSLGGVLYFIATGREPFRADKPIAVLHKICHEPALPANQVNNDIPVTLANIIERLLEKQPHDRFSSASRVHKLLEEYLAELQQPKPNQKPLRVVTRRQIQRRQRVAQLTALSVLFLLMCGAVGWLGAKWLQPQPKKTHGLWDMEVFQDEMRSLRDGIQKLESPNIWTMPLSLPDEATPNRGATSPPEAQIIEIRHTSAHSQMGFRRTPQTTDLADFYLLKPSSDCDAASCDDRESETSPLAMAWTWLRNEYLEIVRTFSIRLTN